MLVQRKKLTTPAYLRVWMVLMVTLFSLGMVSAQNDRPKGKPITYQCENEPLSTALRQVERLSGYYKIQFAFEDVAPYKVSVKLENATVEQAVNQLLKSTKLLLDVDGDRTPAVGYRERC